MTDRVSDRQPASRVDVSGAPEPSTLASVCADLGADLLAVVIAPEGLEVEVVDAVIVDPLEPPSPGRCELLLGVGLDASRADAVPLVETAGAVGAAGLVLKRRGHVADALVLAAERSKVALLTTTAEISWGQLHALVRTATNAGGAPRAEGQEIGDLFGLADAVAAMAGGPVTIEDPQSRVLAFSSLDDLIDSGREATILGRRVPEHWMKRLRATGVFQRLQTSENVVHVEFPGEARPRRAVAIRAGTTLLGSIWVAEGNAPLGDATDPALREAARIAALHLLRHRVREDLERRVRGDMLRSLLQGTGPADLLVHQLELAEAASFTVIAIEAAAAQREEFSLSTPRIVQLIAMYFQSFRRQAVVAASDGRVYALVSRDPDQTRAALLRLTHEALESTAKALKLTLRAGVGADFDHHDGIASSRTQADQALRLLDHNAALAPVVDIDDVRGETLMLDLADFFAAKPHPRSRQLELLAEHDREHATHYVATLRAYLDCFGDSALAAERLQVHPNTLRYRVRRLTEIGQIDFAASAQRFPLELQLKLERPADD